ncbi:hypothetical protein CGCVW01_v013513 [Colletotrichum viniferum]|nr:hypothetical protein CGCVW01_v013513 [Colletotrichum viniferum]
MFPSLFHGSQRAITSRASIHKPPVSSRTSTLNSSTAFQSLPRRQNFSSEAPNTSRERLGNKDALEATKKAYEAHRLALQTETQRKLDAAKEHFQKDIETQLTELGYTAAGRDITADVLDFIRRKPLVAVDLRESAPTCKWYVQKLEEAAASEKEWRAWKWEQVRQGAFFTVIFLVLNNVADSVLNHYGIRHARSPPAKTSEVDKKGEEEKSVRDVEVATVTAKE